MAKTKAAMDKKKREAEKRKKLEKTILRIAAAMPDDPVEQVPAKPDSEAEKARQ